MIGSDATGQVRIYTQSVASALREHLGATDPDLGGPLENQVHTGVTLMSF